MKTHQFKVGEKVRFKGGWPGKEGEIAEVVQLRSAHEDGTAWATFEFDHGRLTCCEDRFETIDA